jgi:phage regulator Rha-like protein/phage antirepressor YoqD-like protein
MVAVQGAMQQPLTMSSHEIAELTGKRHDNVLRDIKGMLTALKIEASAFEGTYRDASGRSLSCFNLPRRECLILVSGYSVELRAKIIDRWQELEERSDGRAIIDPMAALNDPATMRHLLLGYSEKILALEAENKELEVKADALNRIAVAEGSLCITDAAKTLQIQPKVLFTWLQQNQWIYKRPGTDTWIAYQAKIVMGLLEHKTTTVNRPDGSEKVTTQVRVTPKGLARLAEALTPVGEAH